MALQLKTESHTWWVTDKDVFPSGGDSETKYEIRRLTLDKYREIAKSHTKRANYRKPEYRDEEATQDDLFDYVLVNWSGVVIDGQPVPCEWEHKRLLDVPRRVALLDLAGMNEIAAEEDARAESFRSA